MFQLPELGFAYNALEPNIDGRTMEIHHTKHHQGYTNKLNAALESHPDQQSKSIEDLLRNLNQVPESARMSVRNNGGGFYNHSLFWEVLTPGGQGQENIAPQLLEAIQDRFGDLESLHQQFSEAAGKRFGSGWAWLSLDSAGKLVVTSTPNQDNPLMEGMTPILGLDVWEHAYYLNYQNRRPDYVSAFWDLINWNKVSDNYLNAQK